MEDGYFLFIKGKVQNRYNQPDNFELKVLSIQILSELREKMVKAITLKIALTDISEPFLDSITSLLETHPGTCRVRISVYDKNEKMIIEMPSKKYKVDVNSQFVQQLNRIAEVKFKVN
jgi:DNA polymerase-3 subunit alpha